MICREFFHAHKRRKMSFSVLMSVEKQTESFSILMIGAFSMQISTMEISMSLNENLGLSRGITQPTEKKSASLAIPPELCEIPFGPGLIPGELESFSKFDGP